MFLISLAISYGWLCGCAQPSDKQFVVLLFSIRSFCVCFSTVIFHFTTNYRRTVWPKTKKEKTIWTIPKHKCTKHFHTNVAGTISYGIGIDKCKKQINRRKLNGHIWDRAREIARGFLFLCVCVCASFHNSSMHNTIFRSVVFFHSLFRWLYRFFVLAP